MRKIVVMIVLLLGVMGLATQCAPAGEAELQACSVSLDGIYVEFSGKESLARSAVFTISNPNPYLVTIEGFSYTLYADTTALGAKKFINDLYVPAKTDLVVECFAVKDFSSLVTYFFQAEAISIPEATAKAVPIWKSLGGVLPSDALQPIWDAASGAAPTYKAEGVFDVKSPQGQAKTVEYSVTWHE